jgi:hypothetical protein
LTCSSRGRWRTHVRGYEPSPGSSYIGSHHYSGRLSLSYSSFFYYRFHSNFLHFKKNLHHYLPPRIRPQSAVSLPHAGKHAARSLGLEALFLMGLRLVSSVCIGKLKLTALKLFLRKQWYQFCLYLVGRFLGANPSKFWE